MDLDLDPFDDVHLKPAVANARAGGKFQPKAKTKPKNILTASVPVVPQSQATENADASLLNSTNESVSLQPDVADTSVDARKDSPSREECRDSMDALHVEATTSGGDYSHSYSKVTQEVESFETDLDNLDGFPLNACTTRRLGKFQPKVNRQIRREVHAPVFSCLVTSTNKETETIASIDPGKTQLVQSFDAVVGTCPVLETGFGHFTTSELPTNEEHTNIAPNSCSRDANLEDTCEEPEDVNRERKASSASNQINKGDASSRQLRKRTVASRLIDEPENEDAVEPPCSSALGEDDNDHEYRENEDDNNDSGQRYTSQKEKMPKRSKKHAPEKEKTVRKRKGSDDAPNFPSQKAPRKFSHSTRRKKRLQELLALPEDEIEYKSLPCRDVILLAEHREQLASKEAKAAKDSQSTEKSLNGEHSNNEDDTQGNSGMEATLTLFNSHSFMNKTPRVRWSKQDTELFYEGVRQFGTDLSMIQQLFPGRTRNQIKLKLKKEERQQPTRLYEALSNRSKDHSYFEKVIEQLQKVAAEEEGFDKDESVGGAGQEEADLYSENNDVAGKSENDDDAAEDEVNTAQEVHIPAKPDETDDDDDIWSSYRC